MRRTETFDVNTSSMWRNVLQKITKSNSQNHSISSKYTEIRYDIEMKTESEMRMEKNTTTLLCSGVWFSVLYYWPPKKPKQNLKQPEKNHSLFSVPDVRVSEKNM